MSLYDHTDSLGFLTGLSSRLFNNQLAVRFQQAQIDMTPEQWGVLVVLIEHQSMTQAELGEKLYLEKSSVSRCVDVLEKKGWILRAKDPNDSRKKRVSATQKTAEIATRCAEIASQLLNEAQQGVSEQVLENSQQMLGHVIKNLRQMNHN